MACRHGPCGRPTAIAAVPLDGKRQKRCLLIPPILQRFRAYRCRFDCAVARNSGYNTIAFMSDA
eukprot:3277702-Prymnesium_polylepis.1